VDAGEGEWLQICGGASDFVGFGSLSATGEEIVLVEEELAGRGALLDGEGGEGGGFFVGFEHLAEVDITEDIDVVEEEGLL